MAQFAGGQLRLTVRHRNGDRIASTKPVAYDIYDNVAVPRVAINVAGTSQDQAESFSTYIHGSVGEYLTVDFLHTAAVTLATANCVVRLVLTAVFRDPRSGMKRTDPGRPLGIGDRIIKAGATATNDPRGINDNKVTVANEWTACLAFAPAASGENVIPEGLQYLFIDGA